MKKRFKTIAVFTLVIGFVLGVILFTSKGLKAADPSGVHVTVYQTDLMTGSGDTTPVTVFTNVDGKTVDIVGNPDVFGEGPVVAGTYKRIHFVVENQISFAGPNPDPTGLCSGLSSNVTGTFKIDDTKNYTDKVDLYFATADDGGSSGWIANGTVSNPFLIQNVVQVQANATTVVKLIFNTAGTLVCSGSDSVTVNPPMMNALNYVQQTPAAACTGDYWFIHYHVNSYPTDTTGQLIQSPTLQQILASSSVVSGWGTLTIDAPNSSGTGTWQVNMNSTYEDTTTPGMAEHRHNLSRLCTTESWCDDGYYDPVYNPGGPSTMASTYTVSGGQMILSMGGSYLQGAMSSDCSTFVGVNMSGQKDNELIFAVKKTSGLASTLPANMTYVAIGPQINLNYDTTASSPYPATYFGFDPGWMVVSTQTVTNALQMEWKSRFDFSTGGSAWMSIGPSEIVNYANSADLSGMAVRTDGLITRPGDFVAMGAGGSAVMAGETISDPSPTYDNYQASHRVAAGFLMSVATSTTPTPSLTDLTGRWIVGAIEARLNDSDTTWGNGNEQPQFGLSYVDVTIDGNTGSLTRSSTYKDTLSGAMSNDTGADTVELHTECYACDNTATTCKPVTTAPADCVIPGTSNPGMVVPVFYAKSATGGVEMKFVLDTTKKSILLWKPLGASGTPQNCTAPGCADAMASGAAGVGVKVQ